MWSIAKQRYCAHLFNSNSINGKTFGSWTRQQSSSNLSNFESNHIKRIPTLVHSIVLVNDSLDEWYNRGLYRMTTCKWFENWDLSVTFDFSMSQRIYFLSAKAFEHYSCNLWMTTWVPTKKSFARPLGSTFCNFNCSYSDWAGCQGGKIEERL